jgi:hypothetical protein
MAQPAAPGKAGIPQRGCTPPRGRDQGLGLAIADGARRERDMERQQIAAHAGVEHIARIGQEFVGGRRLFEVR